MGVHNPVGWTVFICVVLGFFVALLTGKLVMAAFLLSLCLGMLSTFTYLHFPRRWQKFVYPIKLCVGLLCLTYTGLTQLLVNLLSKLFSAAVSLGRLVLPPTAMAKTAVVIGIILMLVIQERKETPKVA